MAIQTKPFFVIFGESNSGGFALDSDLSPTALAPNPDLQIWNNDLTGFEPIDIGTNNLLGHLGLSGVHPGRHGLEAGLAADLAEPSYMLKSGQGASKIAQWLPSAPEGYWNTFVSRYTLAIAAIRSKGFDPKPIVIWWQGINDADQGLDAAVWRSMTEAHLGRVRALIGNVPIYMPLLMPLPILLPYNGEIQTMASAGLITPINTPNGATDFQDPYHYSASGLKTIAKTISIAIIPTPTPPVPPTPPVAQVAYYWFVAIPFRFKRFWR
jgi:hypothetical protein